MNVSLNNAHNITPAHLTLADAPGVAVLHHDQGNWGHSIMKPLSANSEQVPKDSLSNICEAHGVADVSLMKFNCEGVEFPILLSTPVEVLQEIRRCSCAVPPGLGELHARGAY